MALDSALRKPDAEPADEYRHAPHNVEVEQALIGAILVNNDAFYRIADFLEPKHFFEPIHQKVFEIAAGLIRAGKVATPVTLKTFLPTDADIAGLTPAQYLARLAAEATTVVNAEDYGRTIYDLSIRRDLIRIGEDMVNLAYDAPVDIKPGQQIEDAERRLYRARRDRALRPGLPALLRRAQGRRRPREQGLPARRASLGLGHRHDRPRSADGRDAAFGPRHPRGTPGHGQDGAGDQRRLSTSRSNIAAGRGPTARSRRYRAASSASSRSKCRPSSSPPASSPSRPKSPPPASGAATSASRTSPSSRRRRR